MPDPKILNRQDAIVKITSTAICGSDLHLLSCVPTMEPGDILGHEFMGEVVEVGRKGDQPQGRRPRRGALPHRLRQLLPCQKDLFSVCENSNPKCGWPRSCGAIAGGPLRLLAHAGGYAGGQAEYARVPFADVGPLKVPGGLTDDQVLFLSDILPTGYMGAEMCDIKPGHVIAVWGSGPVGQFAIVSACLLGAERISPSTASATASDGPRARRRPDTQLRGSGRAGGAGGDDRRARPRRLHRRCGRGGPRTGPSYAYDRMKQARIEPDRPLALREAILACRNGGADSVIRSMAASRQLPWARDEPVPDAEGRPDPRAPLLRPLLERIQHGHIRPHLYHHPQAVAGGVAPRATISSSISRTSHRRSCSKPNDGVSAMSFPIATNTRRLHCRPAPTAQGSPPMAMGCRPTRYPLPCLAAPCWWRGLRRGSGDGLVLALAGGDLLCKGVTGRHLHEALAFRPGDGAQLQGTASTPTVPEVERTLTIGAPADELYRLWRQPETPNRVMGHVGEVTVRSEDEAHWVVHGPLGQTWEWDTRIVEEQPGERVRWESLPGAAFPNEGEVTFRPAPGDWGTEVTLSCESGSAGWAGRCRRAPACRTRTGPDGREGPAPVQEPGRDGRGPDARPPTGRPGDGRTSEEVCMRAICWNGVNDLRVETVPDPEIVNPQDAILKVRLSTTCGSDLHFIDGYIPTMQRGRRDRPRVHGRDRRGSARRSSSVSGATGSSSPRSSPAASCWYCEHDLYSLCDNTNPKPDLQEPLLGYPTAGIYGYTHAFGGYAGFARAVHARAVRRQRLLPRPRGRPDEQALFLSDAAPTGFMGADFCAIEPGDTVAVWGCGGVGLMAQQSAFLLGAGAGDRHRPLPRAAAHGARARRLGDDRLHRRRPSSTTLKEMTGGRGPDA